MLNSVLKILNLGQKKYKKSSYTSITEIYFIDKICLISVNNLTISIILVYMIHREELQLYANCLNINQALFEISCHKTLEILHPLAHVQELLGLAGCLREYSKTWAWLVVLESTVKLGLGWLS